MESADLRKALEHIFRRHDAGEKFDHKNLDVFELLSSLSLEDVRQVSPLPPVVKDTFGAFPRSRFILRGKEWGRPSSFKSLPTGNSMLALVSTHATMDSVNEELMNVPISQVKFRGVQSSTGQVHRPTAQNEGLGLLSSGVEGSNKSIEIRWLTLFKEIDPQSKSQTARQINKVNQSRIQSSRFAHKESTGKCSIVRLLDSTWSLVQVLVKKTLVDDGLPSSQQRLGHQVHDMSGENTLKTMNIERLEIDGSIDEENDVAIFIEQFLSTEEDHSPCDLVQEAQSKIALHSECDAIQLDSLEAYAEAEIVVDSTTNRDENQPNSVPTQEWMAEDEDQVIGLVSGSHDNDSLSSELLDKIFTPRGQHDGSSASLGYSHATPADICANKLSVSNSEKEEENSSSNQHQEPNELNGLDGKGFTRNEVQEISNLRQRVHNLEVEVTRMRKLLEKVLEPRVDKSDEDNGIAGSQEPRIPETRSEYGDLSLMDASSVITSALDNLSLASPEDQLSRTAMVRPLSLLGKRNIVSEESSLSSVNKPIAHPSTISFSEKLRKEFNEAISTFTGLLIHPEDGFRLLNFKYRNDTVANLKQEADKLHEVALRYLARLSPDFQTCWGSTIRGDAGMMAKAKGMMPSETYCSMIRLGVFWEISIKAVILEDSIVWMEAQCSILTMAPKFQSLLFFDFGVQEMKQSLMECDGCDSFESSMIDLNTCCARRLNERIKNEQKYQFRQELKKLEQEQKMQNDRWAASRPTSRPRLT